MTEGRRPATRRVVTVLFSDLVGSTALGEALEPETMRLLMGRYFSGMGAVIERHGGTVEKFIGDAIMAVFGLSQINEDDALRAVRAALEMRSTLDTLNHEFQLDLGLTIVARTGINTGVVIAGGEADGQPVVTGDAVNTAARLEQAATPGEILLGATTWALVRGAVAAEEIAGISAKGKAATVQAYRLHGLHDDAMARGGPAEGSPLVGRARELRVLHDALVTATTVGGPRTLVVLGDAGVGKSRLVAEFAAQVGDRATVLRGRCLPYGDGITYWPLRGLLLRAAGIDDKDAPEVATQALEALVAGHPDASILSARLASAVGLSAAPASTEEIFWAVRRTFEAIARRHPLVVIVEDLHWAEPILLDLLRHVAGAAGAVPLLLVGLARPDLLETSPAWANPAPGTTVLTVEALDGDAAGALADMVAGDLVIPPDLRDRILAAADGNPLFVEEMVRMAVDDAAARSGDGVVASGELDAALAVPPTIQALLAARLDRLPDVERTSAQRGSVVGRVFEEPAVLALSPDRSESDIVDSLGDLVRREFLSRERSELSAGAAFKFRHILIRDAAYEALPKSERAVLHERFGDWLERAAGNRIGEYQEIVGYHLAEAHRYRMELRDRSDPNVVLAARAAEHLRAAAGRARDRGDSAGAAEILDRATGLSLTNQGARAELLFESARVLLEAGRLSEARTRADEALELAIGLADRRLAAEARLLAVEVSFNDGSLVDADDATGLEIAAALADAEASGDARALAQAWSMQGGRAYMDGRFAEASTAWRHSLNDARRSGDTRRALEQELNLLVLAVVGTTRAADGLAFGLGLLERLEGYPSLRADALRLVAPMEAMLQRFADAQAHAELSVSILQELDRRPDIITALADQSWVMRLAGDLDGAEEVLREAFSLAVAGRDRTARSWVACRLAQVLLELDRPVEAEPFVVEAEQVPIVMNRTRVVGARARLLAAADDLGADDALERLLAMLEDVPYPNIRIDGFLDAAAVTAVRGRSNDALHYAGEALRLAEAKGNVARARQIRMLMERVERR